MNLSKLFELQRQLDERIEREHPRQEGEDRLAKKIHALLVELGELANELPEVFKFWSNKKNNRKKALEEFCDALHFILSIGLEITQQDSIDIEIEKWKSCGTAESETIVGQFLSVMYMTNEVYYGEEKISSYELLFAKFIRLGEMLGFTWEQIEAAYMQKNAENHRRQDSNY